LPTQTRLFISPVSKIKFTTTQTSPRKESTNILLRARTRDQNEIDNQLQHQSANDKTNPSPLARKKKKKSNIELTIHLELHLTINKEAFFHAMGRSHHTAAVDSLRSRRKAPG
jgi:hypothetical protein